MFAKAVGFTAEGGLEVVQIATADQDTLQYSSSTAAIKEGLLEVREMSEAGSVNNRRDIFREYFPRLLRGVAAEVLYGRRKQKPPAEAEASYRALEFLDQFESLDLEEFPGVGVGVERRFDRKTMTGFELRCQNAMVHLTALKQGDKHRTSFQE
jgi:hypothetical protein